MKVDNRDRDTAASEVVTSQCGWGGAHRVSSSDVDITTYKKRYVSPEERQQIIDKLRLVTKKDAYFYKLLMN